MPELMLLLVALPLAMVAVVVARGALRAAADALAKGGWPVVGGTIAGYEFVKSEDEDHHSGWQARVLYSYVVSGLKSTMAISGPRSASRDEVERMVLARYPVGSSGQVQYHPRFPERSFVVARAPGRV